MTEGSSDPYALLGIAPQSSFEEVQAARQAKLDAVGDDPLARARVETAYDAILMDRLKERQQGRVSSAARSASQKETLPTPPRVPLAPLQNLPSLPLPRLGGGSKPSGGGIAISMATGRERWFPLIGHGTLFVLALVLPATAPEALLALAALITLVNLQRRHGRFLKSVGWSLLLVMLGLGLSNWLLAALPTTIWPSSPVQPYQVQTAFAVVVQLVGALFL